MTITEKQILISQPEGIYEIRKHNANTGDIVNEILKADRGVSKYTVNLSKFLLGNSIIETCKNIFDFLKSNIRYVKDDEQLQLLKAPSMLWATKEGDCKSLSLFTASVLRNLNIPYKYTFISQDQNKTLTHVFVTAIDEKKKDVLIDVVYGRFNEEPNYTYKKEYMTDVAYVSGVNRCHGVGDTVIQLPSAWNYVIKNTPEFIKIRDGILVLINANYLNLATLLGQKITAGGGNDLKLKWENYGGNYQMLFDNIKVGKNKEPIIDNETLAHGFFASLKKAFNKLGRPLQLLIVGVVGVLLCGGASPLWPVTSGILYGLLTDDWKYLTGFHPGIYKMPTDKMTAIMDYLKNYHKVAGGQSITGISGWFGNMIDQYYHYVIGDDWGPAQYQDTPGDSPGSSPTNFANYDDLLNQVKKDVPDLGKASYIANIIWDAIKQGATALQIQNLFTNLEQGTRNLNYVSGGQFDWAGVDDRGNATIHAIGGIPLVSIGDTIKLTSTAPELSGKSIKIIGLEGTNNDTMIIDLTCTWKGSGRTLSGTWLKTAAGSPGGSTGINWLPIAAVGAGALVLFKFIF